MRILLIAAILPVFLLGYYIYKKDVNHEPIKLLAVIFSLGFVSAVPVIIVEKLLDNFFPTDGISNFIQLFINVFISVALVEEGFKWLVTRIVGYDSKEFDEVYDIIVYSVFASLGFACIENILYVFTYGLGNAILRAVLSIPGHTCFGIIMGYFLAKAKVGQINNNNSKYYNNMILSIIIPCVAHTLYDSFLFYASANQSSYSLIFFLVFYITMVIICFQTIDSISSIQHHLNDNFSTGVLKRSDDGQLVYKPVSEETSVINYCPVCGNYVKDSNYCSCCGFHVK